MKICPSCNTRVQPQAAKCPSCGRGFEERAPRQTMMGIPAVFDEESEGTDDHQGRTAAAPRSTLFGLPAINAEGEVDEQHEARTAMVSAADLPFAPPGGGSDASDDDSTRQVDTAKLRAAFQSQKGAQADPAQQADPRATAFGMPSPIQQPGGGRQSQPTPVAFEEPSDEDEALSAWGLGEASSEEMATQVISASDFANSEAGGGSMSVDKSEGGRGDGRLHTLMGMSLEEESDLMSGGGAMRVGGSQSDGDDAPTQAMSVAQLKAGAAKLTKGASLRDRLKKGMENAAREPLPTPTDLRTDVIPGQVTEPGEDEARENPFTRSANRDTPRSGVYKVARRGREGADDGAGMAEDSGVLSTTGTYQVGNTTSEPLREQPFGEGERPRTAFPTSEASPAGRAKVERTESTPGFMDEGDSTDVTPGTAASAAPNPWERKSTGPRFGVRLPEPDVQSTPPVEDVPELEVEALDPAPEPLATQQPVASPQGFGTSPSPAPLATQQPAPSPQGFGTSPSSAPLATQQPAPSPQGFGTSPSPAPLATQQPAPAPQPAPAQQPAAAGAEALVATLQKVCGVMAGLTLVAATAIGVLGGEALTALTLVPAVMGVLAMLLPFLPISRGVASGGFALVALGTLGAVVASVLGGSSALALFVQFGGGLLAAFAAAFPLVLKLVKPS